MNKMLGRASSASVARALLSKFASKKSSTVIRFIIFQIILP
jgi:hypothetical protein